MSDTCKYCGAEIRPAFFETREGYVWITGSLNTPANQICEQNLKGSREHEPLITPPATITVDRMNPGLAYVYVDGSKLGEITIRIDCFAFKGEPNAYSTASELRQIADVIDNGLGSSD